MTTAQKKPITTQQTTPAQQPEPESDLVRSLRQQERAQAITTATARRAAITADLADARILAEAARQRLAIAQANWDVNETHTSDEAIRLEARQREAAATAAKVEELAAALDQVDGDLRMLQHDATREANIALAAELWPPMVRRMMQAARDFYAVLDEQAKVKEQLVDAGAWGLVGIGDLVMPDVTYLGEPSDSISRWLEACERVGLTTEGAK